MTSYQDMDMAGEAFVKCMKKCDRKIVYFGFVSIGVIILYNFNFLLEFS